MGWIERAHGLVPGRQHAVRAIALDDRDPWGHIALGYCAMMEHRTRNRSRRSGVRSASIRIQLRRIPISVTGWVLPDWTVRRSNMARKRSGSVHSIRRWHCFLGGIAVAHYTAGRYAEAANYTSEALRLRPGFQGAQRLHCASLAQSGRIDEAKSYLATVKREQPQISLEWIRSNVPYQTPELTELFLDGMRKAGLD